MKTNTKILPLIEDLGRVLPSKFLTSTEYKRWLVEIGLDEVWDKCVSSIRQNRNFFIAGYDHAASDAKDALGYLINVLFEQKHELLPSFLYKLLSFYAEQESEYVDVSSIKKDLHAAGYLDEEIAVLDNISLPQPLKEKIQEEQTQAQKVRLLEEVYMAEREDDSYIAIDAYRKWHAEALLYLDSFYTEANPDYAKFKHLDNSGDGYTLRSNFNSIYSIYNLLMNRVSEQDIAKVVSLSKKTPMVFISHSHSDEDFVLALVNLLEDMGLTSDTLFCSTVREFGISLSGDIFETIRDLFLDHDLYVIFVHSPRFYGSAVALNEMGAAWVLKSDFCSFLTNDMDYSKMKGVVNDAKISIKVDEKGASALLNDLFKHISALFNLQTMDMNKWERKRDQFLSVVRSLKYEEVKDSVEENSVDTEYKLLQIEKMKAEANDRLKAIIRGNIVKGYKGSASILKLFNAGASTARNVRVEWKNQNEYVMIRGSFSLIGDLTPQNSRSYSLLLTEGHPETIDLIYSWDDDFALGNQIVESLQL